MLASPAAIASLVALSKATYAVAGHTGDGPSSFSGGGGPLITCSRVVHDA
ncbi:hypothetical protein [Archangium violaceum]